MNKNLANIYHMTPCKN